LFLVGRASDQLQPLNLLTVAILKQTFSASKLNRLMNRQPIKTIHLMGG
jgi:hypothetical protein